MKKFFIWLFVLFLVSFVLVSATSLTTAQLNQRLQSSVSNYSSYIWVALQPIIAYLLIIVLIGILIFYTGTGQVFQIILQVYHTIINIVRSFFEVMTNVAPKFIKVLFFILLFWLIAPMIYNFTFGLTVVCAENGSVYRGDILSSYIYTFLPEADEKTVVNFTFATTSATGGLFDLSVLLPGVPVFTSGFEKRAGNYTYYLIPNDYIGIYADENAGVAGIGGYPFCVKYDSVTNTNQLVAVANYGSADCLWTFIYSAFNVAGTNYARVAVNKEYDKWLSSSTLYNNATAVPATSSTIALEYDSDVFNVENVGYRILLFDNSIMAKSTSTNPIIKALDAIKRLFFRSSGHIAVLVGDKYVEGRTPTKNISQSSCNAINPSSCDKYVLNDVKKDKNTFRDNFFINVDGINKDSNSFITYQCDSCKDGSKVNSTNSKCSRSDSEELYVVGVPIFNFEIVIILMFIALLLWIISKKR